MTSDRPGRRRSVLLGNVALSASSVVFVWLVLEALALTKLVDYRLVFAGAATDLTSVKPWDNPRNRPDSALLWIHRPGQRIQGEVVGDMVQWLGIATDRRYPIDVTYDRWGFRNARDLDSAEVVLIGDSFLEWSLVPGDQLVSSHLERALGVPVMNLGQAAYGPQQELTVLRRFGLPRKPAAVVWFFFEGNDLLDVPRFERFAAEARGAGKAGSTRLTDRAFATNAARALGRLRRAERPSADGEEARRRSCRPRVAGGEPTTVYFAYAGTPLTAADSLALQKTWRLVAEAKASADSASARFLLVFVPTKFRVYHDRCDFPADGYGRTWRPNDLPAGMAARADSAGIAFLDLTGPLRDAGKRAPLLYFEDDGHWTARGHAVAAGAVAAALQRLGLMPLGLPTR